jgi:hypothetical protein
MIKWIRNQIKLLRSIEEVRPTDNKSLVCIKTEHIAYEWRYTVMYRFSSDSNFWFKNSVYTNEPEARRHALDLKNKFDKLELKEIAPQYEYL